MKQLVTIYSYAQLSSKVRISAQIMQKK